jgi:hypothetical protein
MAAATRDGRSAAERARNAFTIPPVLRQSISLSGSPIEWGNCRCSARIAICDEAAHLPSSAAGALG